MIGTIDFPRQILPSGEQIEIRPKVPSQGPPTEVFERLRDAAEGVWSWKWN